METAYFAAGCFWGVQQIFDQIEGVKETTVGYMGGHSENPTYREICSKSTGHAEVVEVKFDPSVVKYEKLVDTFFKIHNPTTKNRQGPDIGSQYRSAIFLTSADQEVLAKNTIELLERKEQFKDPIVTELNGPCTFYAAEEYHQKYFDKNGGGACHILPKD
ncbi:MAG: peptide-methionine (S)-S-oxide reductase MsrA [Bacteriovoracaceae bacterium]|nr:peptide-methionine (S)-S-oxide reductase MsrA [Bacteriovoracaceae bacterium]